jgi:LysR family transcriptional regulator for bpeEF and oprC
MSVFVRVAEARSFTAASSRLGLSPSAVSKAISRLEERVGARLLYRNTRNVSLTDEGKALLERSRQILSDLDDLESVLSRRRYKPRGRLRIQMPTAFGRRVIMPLVAEFSEHNPDVVIDAELSDRVPDLAEEGLDAVVRSGEFRDSHLAARKLCEIRYASVASPAYLARHGVPKTPGDLDKHRCLGSYMPHAHRYRDWTFILNGSESARPMHGQLNVNNAEALVDAAVRGLGIATLATFVAAEPIRSGLLRVVLQEYMPPGPTLWVVYPEREFLPARVQAFVDFLSDRVPRLDGASHSQRRS